MNASGFKGRGRAVQGETAHPRIGRRRLFVALAMAIAWTCLSAASAYAAQAWRVDSMTDTTVAPGGTVEYLVQIVNVGDQPTDGSQIALTGRLAAGLTVVDARMFDPAHDFLLFNPVDCTAGDGSSPAEGASDVQCVTSDAIGHLEYRLLKLTVRADPGAAGTLTSSFSVAGGGAPEADTVDPIRVASTPPGFGIAAFDGEIADAAGNPYTQAGGHPDSASVSIDFNTITKPEPVAGSVWPVEPVKDLFVDMPPGLIGDPAAADQCTGSQLAGSANTSFLPDCPATSQIGTAFVRENGVPLYRPALGPIAVYNLVPPPGVPARFGFNIFRSVVVMDASVRTGGDYGLSVNTSNIPAALPLSGTTVTFWGIPASSSHDGERACQGQNTPVFGGPTCPSGAPLRAFLRNPTSCSAPGVGLATTAHVDSWFHPGDFQTATFLSHLLPGFPAAPEDWGAQTATTGCGSVPFDPRFTGVPESGRPDTPTGFAFDLSLPQNDDPSLIGESDLKSAVVTLPQGVRVSPSSADGLQACSPDQIRLHDASAPSCPDASKIGSVTIDTPLLARPLTGGIYLATPHANPFGTLLSLYVVGEGSGVVVKLAGRVDADPLTGQLTTTFDDNPQLPFSNLHLQFDGGPRAPLVTPKTCGSQTASAVLTGWNGRQVETTTSFTISGDGNGGSCPPTGFSPSFAAGTERPVAGASSQLDVRIARSDADQELGSVSVRLPAGLTAKIANATLCSSADGNAGTCPEVSRIGDVTVGAGAGPDPFYITNGRAYITGPYKGAPFGLSMVVPAVAGPFDLGNVVVRSAIFIDKHDATVRVVSDPLPTILQGIPLDVRDVRVSANKPNFFLNPTSCARKTVTGEVDSTAGARANVSSPFQVGECANLGFKPHMALSVGGAGHTHAGEPTPLTTRITMPRGDANLRYVRVTLPKTIDARLTVINDACTRQQFESDVAKCAHARAGTATAVTPLLRDPLRGNVYFVKNGHPLPDLFIALRGQVAFDLIGRITIVNSTRLRTTFNAAPDVPIRSFSLRLFGDSRNGSVGAAANLCSASSKRQAAQLDYIGQNGKVSQVAQRLAVHGCPPHPARHAAAHGRARG